MLPPAEIRAAVQKIVEDNLGATEDELLAATIRAFGFKAASGPLKDAVTRQIVTLIEQGGFSRSGDLIVIGMVMPAGYDTTATPARPPDVTSPLGGIDRAGARRGTGPSRRPAAG